MTDCLVVQPIAPAAIALMRRAGLAVHEATSPDLAAMRPHLATARAVITRNRGFPAEAIAAAPRLLVIGSHGTGMDGIDQAAAAARGILVLNTPGTNAQSVAEHTLGLILSCARMLPEADAALRAGRWSFRDTARPMELAGKTLGLVGWGHAARRLAGFARAIGLAVIACSRHAAPADLAAAGVAVAPGLDALCEVSDIVSLHAVPAPGLRLDAGRLARFRPGAILVNTARGALLDETALAAALRAGRLRAAALDVFTAEPPPPDSPLFGCPNLILTPHLAGISPEALERTGLEVARRVIAALGLAGRPEPG